MSGFTPMNCQVSEVRTDQGLALIRIGFTSITGQFDTYLDAEAAKKIGKMIVDAGEKATASRLIVPGIDPDTMQAAADVLRNGKRNGPGS